MAAKLKNQKTIVTLSLFVPFPSGLKIKSVVLAQFREEISTSSGHMLDGSIFHLFPHSWNRQLQDSIQTWISRLPSSLLVYMKL